MFKTKTTQRKNFSFTIDQIRGDIDNIKHDKVQQSLLYTCLDEKMPMPEKKFLQVQQFLKGSDDLEKSVLVLEELSGKLENLRKELARQSELIKEQAHELMEQT